MEQLLLHLDAAPAALQAALLHLLLLILLLPVVNNLNIYHYNRHYALLAHSLNDGLFFLTNLIFHTHLGVDINHIVHTNFIVHILIFQRTLNKWPLHPNGSIKHQHDPPPAWINLNHTPSFHLHWLDPAHHQCRVRYLHLWPPTVHDSSNHSSFNHTVDHSRIKLSSSNQC